MFNLSAQELDNAFAAITHHGYSTMLPEPPEWSVVAANWPSIRQALEKIDLDTYEPYSPLQVFAPKSRSSIRLLHVLHPQDLILYTAMVLIAKNDIEINRVSIKSKRVFSFRADTKNDNQLYGARGSYDAYRNQLQEKAAKSKVKFVAVADIADFYNRIYQHRLENAIEAVSTGQRVRDVARVLVRKFISHLMRRDSYGIPVGPYASRLLAEALLIDVDASLQTGHVDFVRWVDDYNIFCETEYEAQSVLFTLGEWLFSKHGLTLQSAKTKIFTLADYKKVVLLDHGERLTDRDTVIQMFKDFDNEYEEEDDDEEPDEEEVQRVLDRLQSADLMKMLRNSLADSSLVDYQAVEYALSRLPRIPSAPTKLKRDVLHFVVDNAQLLYPVAEQIANYILSISDLTSSERREIATKLLKPLKNKKHPPPYYYAMWVLHVFASSLEWNHAQDIVSLYRQATSEVVRRYAALAISTSGTRADALAIKDDYASASPLMRSAILFASKKLGADERKHWKLAAGIGGLIEKMI